MKVKDLSPNKPLKGLKMRTKKGVIGYYFSTFDTGIFFNDVQGESTDKGKLFPQILMKPDDILQWDIMDDYIPTNCDSLISLKHTIND